MDKISFVVPVALICIVVYIFCSVVITSLQRTGYNPPIHESAIVTLVGILLGYILRRFGVVIEFSHELFFYLVLPPIIFNAGFSLKRKRFFKYMHYILLFGVVGSLLSIASISISAYLYTHYFSTFKLPPFTVMESMIYGSVLAASDEVAALSLIDIETFPKLGALMFGEGIINDAISIVFFRTLYQKLAHSISAPLSYLDMASIALEFGMQIVVSSCIGVTTGLVCSRIFHTYRNSLLVFPTQQVSLILLFAFTAYSVAEALNISGILTLFICAIVQAHYSWHSMSSTAQLAAKVSFGALSDICEGFSFSYVGLSVWTYIIPPKHSLYDNDDGTHRTTTRSDAADTEYSPDPSSGHQHAAFDLSFSLYTLLVVIISRLLIVPLLVNVFNHLTGRNVRPGGSTFTHSDQFKLALGGCVRGSLCMAQVLQLTYIEMSRMDVALYMQSTALFVILTSTVGCGVWLPLILTPPSTVALPRALIPVVSPAANIGGGYAVEGTRVGPEGQQISPPKYLRLRPPVAGWHGSMRGPKKSNYGAIAEEEGNDWGDDGDEGDEQHRVDTEQEAGVKDGVVEETSPISEHSDLTSISTFPGVSGRAVGFHLHPSTYQPSLSYALSDGGNEIGDGNGDGDGDESLSPMTYISQSTLGEGAALHGSSHLLHGLHGILGTFALSPTDTKSIGNEYLLCDDDDSAADTTDTITLTTMMATTTPSNVIVRSGEEVEGVEGRRAGRTTLYSIFKKADEMYLKPFFGGRSREPREPRPDRYSEDDYADYY